MNKNIIIGFSWCCILFTLVLDSFLYDFYNVSLLDIKEIGIENINKIFHSYYFYILNSILFTLIKIINKNDILSISLNCIIFLMLYEFLLIYFLSEIIINNMFLYILLKSLCLSYLLNEYINWYKSLR